MRAASSYLAAAFALACLGCSGATAPALRSASEGPDDELDEAIRQLDPGRRARLGRAIDRLRKLRGSKTVDETTEAGRLLEVLRSEDEISGFVEVRIVDAATGRPLAARVTVADRFGHVAGDMGAGFGAWADGRFRAKVLAGRVTVTVSKGRRYMAARKVVPVRPGRTERVSLKMAKPEALDLEKTGWVGCDMRFSVGGPKGLRRKASLSLVELAARSEGVGAVFVVQPWRSRDKSYNKDDPALRPQALTGKMRAISRGRTGLYWGYERRSAPPYGRLVGLGMKDWRTVSRYASSLLYPNSLAAGEIHRQGGLAIYANPSQARAMETASAGIGPGMREYYRGVGTAWEGLASELPFDTVAGPLYDAVEITGSEADERVWFRVLTEGFRVPAVGATGGSIEAGDIPAERTIVRVKGKPTEAAILDGIRRGRCMVTTGPYVFLEISGRRPGDVIDSGTGMFRARIEAISQAVEGAYLAKVDLIRNGRVVLSEKAVRGQTRLRMELPFAEPSTAWFVARVTAADGTRAWTNPVYFARPGEKGPRPARTRVLATVVDAATGEPLDGNVRLYDPTGKTVDSRRFARGAFSLIAPASAGIEISARGYTPQRRLLFFESGADEHVKAIHTDRAGLGAAELERSATYTRARTAASAATMRIRLRKPSR